MTPPRRAAGRPPAEAGWRTDAGGGTMRGVRPPFPDGHAGDRASAAAPDFDAALARAGLPPLVRGRVETLQVNVGKRCNQACHHCHVDAGPNRTERMDARTAERVLALLAANPDVALLDLTGGAPELNPHFRDLVRGARALGRRVVDRCNLTVLLQPGLEDTAEFLAAHGVEIVASLPCWAEDNVDRQRGRGVYAQSITALRRLNALGYGQDGLPLDLVYNPVGAHLPPPQATLEAEYRVQLRARHGIEFRRLLTITNMPIKRFAHDLARQGKLAEYQGLLVNHFNAQTVEGLMCRTLVSVGFDGRLYDCDFNQMLELEWTPPVRTIWDVDDLRALAGRGIVTGPHCFGCTAGAGSSCGGVLAAS